MTLDDVIQELIQLLAHDGDTLLSWEQVQRWPKGAVQVFQSAGWIVPASLASEVTCPGCEEACYMPVDKLVLGANGKPARGYIACDKRADMGTVKINPVRMQQWQLTHGQLAQWVARSLGLKGKLQKDIASGCFKLGSIQGNERIGSLEFDTENAICVKSSVHTLPLAQIVIFDNNQLIVDQKAIVAMVDLPPGKVAKIKKKNEKPVVDSEGLEIGSPEWRSQTARNAANKRHDQPGGSRDKQRQIKEIWATGKYSSRDLCAEQECAALAMSFSAARRALINTPEPANKTTT